MSTGRRRSTRLLASTVATVAAPATVATRKVSIKQEGLVVADDMDITGGSVKKKGKSTKSATGQRTEIEVGEAVQFVASRVMAGAEAQAMLGATAARPSEEPIANMKAEIEPKYNAARKRARKTPGEKAEKPAKKPKMQKESRVDRIRVRTSCPQATADRIQRVFQQRMFLVDRERNGDELKEVFSMLGSTGNVYTITVGNRLHCDCPDFRKTRSPCKHLLFVFLKVLRISPDSTLVYQKAFLPEELKAIFAAAPPSPTDVLAHAHVRAAFRGEDLDEAEVNNTPLNADGTPKRRPPEVGDDCPVCYSEMEVTEALAFCEGFGGCGRAVHTECFAMWTRTSRAKGQDPTCVWCRAAWNTPVAPGKGKGKCKALGPTTTAFYGTYTNLGALAGMPATRDTSTYYHGPTRGGRIDYN